MIRPCQKALIAAALLVFSAAEASAQARAPRFTQYAVSVVYKGPNAPVKLSKDDRAFRTRIRGAAKDKPNFAGEFILAQWGCGAECLTTVVISGEPEGFTACPLASVAGALTLMRSILNSTAVFSSSGACETKVKAMGRKIRTITNSVAAASALSGR